MPVYWCEMVLLPHTHPYPNALLGDEQFAVQRSAKSACGCSCGSDNWTTDEQGFEDKGWYCWYQPQPRSRSALDPNISRQS